MKTTALDHGELLLISNKKISDNNDLQRARMGVGLECHYPWTPLEQYSQSPSGRRLENYQDLTSLRRA